MNKFGYELRINLFDCDKKIISTREKLQQYCDELCELIKMKKFGPANIQWFGSNAEHTKGFTLVQLIETSSITAHFSAAWGNAYINIFSCLDFNEVSVLKYTVEFFKAQSSKHDFTAR